MPAVTTDKKLKLNLGCGGSKLVNFINIDNEDITEPDLKLDLMNFPWPFEDNSVDHIVAKDILSFDFNNSKDHDNNTKIGIKKGMKVFAFIGFDGGEILKLNELVKIHVNSELGMYGEVENLHLLFCHYIVNKLTLE